MMTTVAQVVLLGNLPDEGKEQRIIEYMAEAERELRDAIGTDVYDTIEADVDGGWTEDKTRLARAEAFLTLAELAPILNLRINPNDGGFVSSVGFGESKNELLDQEGIAGIVQMFRDKAEVIISDYVEISDDEEDEIGGDESVGWFSV